MSSNIPDNTNWALWDCASVPEEPKVAVVQPQMLFDVSQNSAPSSTAGSIVDRFEQLSTDHPSSDFLAYYGISGISPTRPLITATTPLSQSTQTDNAYSYPPLTDTLDGTTATASIPGWLYGLSDSISIADSTSNTSNPSLDPRQQRRREQNRKAQLNFRQKQRNEVHRLQLQVIQLQAQLAQVNSQVAAAAPQVTGCEYCCADASAALSICSLCKSYAKRCD